MYFQSFLYLSLSLTPWLTALFLSSVKEDSSQRGVKGKKWEKLEWKHSEKTIVVALSPCKMLVWCMCPGQNHCTALILLPLFCLSASWKPGTVALTQTIVCYSVSLPNTNLTTCSMANIMSRSKYIHWMCLEIYEAICIKPREARCTCVLFRAFHCECGGEWRVGLILDFGKAYCRLHR